MKEKMIFKTDEELVEEADNVTAKFISLRSQLKEFASHYDFDINDCEGDILNKIFAYLKNKRDEEYSVIRQQIPSAINNLIAKVNGENIDTIYQTIQTIKQLDAEGKCKELYELVNTIQGKSENKTKETSAPRTHKNPQTVLKVSYPNGEVIQFAQAADTIVEVVRRAGFAKIERLGLRSSGVFLVARETTDGRNVRQCEDGWFVSTHSNTQAKKRQIEIISEELGLGLKVEIV